MFRAFVLSLIGLLAGAFFAHAEVRIVGETKYKPHALVRLRAEGLDPKAGLLWRVSPNRIDRATTPKDRLEFSAHPGTYDVDLIAVQVVDGNTLIDETRVTITIDGCTPVPPAPQPLPPIPQPPIVQPPPVTPPAPHEPKPDAIAATTRIRFGTAGCTATIIHPRRSDGRWDLVTAAHCVGSIGVKGVAYLRDGRNFNVTLVTKDVACDVAWLVTDESIESMPFAKLATSVPEAGTKIWHNGYGFDRPSNREDGVVLEGRTTAGQMVMTLNVSSGDSGGGIFRTDTDELVSVVCCTRGIAQKTTMYGGTSVAAAAIRPKVRNSDAATSTTEGAIHPIQFHPIVEEPK